jgi:hypothetical protein
MEPSTLILAVDPGDRIMMKVFGFAAAAAFAVGCAFGTAPAEAAALPSSVAKLQSAVPSQATTVQYRRWGGGGGRWVGPGRWYGWRGGYWGPGWGWGGFYGGLAAGTVIGAAAAAPYYPYYYAPPPAVYAAPGPAPGAVRQCWVSTDDSRGYGYWHPC